MIKLDPFVLCIYCVPLGIVMMIYLLLITIFLAIIGVFYYRLKYFLIYSLKCREDIEQYQIFTCEGSMATSHHQCKYNQRKIMVFPVVSL